MSWFILGTPGPNPLGEEGPGSPSLWIDQTEGPQRSALRPLGGTGLQSRADLLLQGVWHLISPPTAGSARSIFFVVQTE